MVPRNRKRVRPCILEPLEIRQLLAAPEIIGNTGQILFSQFQPFGFRTTVGTQLHNVKVRGAVTIDVVNPSSSTAAAQLLDAPAPNAGLVKFSQFNGGGFLTVGLQFDRVTLGDGLTVTGSDNEDNGAIGTGTVLSAAGVANAQGNLPTSGNTGLILNSQYNDGGFGILERNANGTVVGREGRVGLQWRNTRVRGQVNVGVDVQVIQPGASSPTAAVSTVAPALTSTVAPATSSSDSTVIDLLTNIGQIRNSQFNDGGFGDIGMQWMDVAVGRHVGTSSNSLFINPLQNNGAPITVSNQVFGQTATQGSSDAVANTLSNDPVAQPETTSSTAAVPSPGVETTYTNSATNSGRIVGAQFNDGGFGDIGLQWRKVSVGGSVTAVHNSLTVQPENKGQGLITVQGVQFPNNTPAPQPSPEKLRALAATPPVVAHDGNSVKGKLPKPTGPLSPFFKVPFSGPGTLTLPYAGNHHLVNAATNSGLDLGGQLNAGGFGDEGLQWQKVHVSGNVQLVHNSLSVQPEGTQLAGISVSNVSYGPAVSASVASHLSVLPYAVISSNTDSPTTAPKVHKTQSLVPPNDRWLTDQQLASADGTDVFLQWNGIEHSRGLVLVHNIILIKGVGPLTGPITLNNIRFPFRVPTLAPLEIVTTPSSASPSASSASTSAKTGVASARKRKALLLNSANNSGILSHAQFSDGGFGDIGLQWRNVSVAGSVAVVHNTLSVDETADSTPGDIPGPITISNVTFNSGALNGPLSRKTSQIIVSPPDHIERKSTHRINAGKALPQNPAVLNDATNSGILGGGQLSAGGSKHALLQWQCVKVGGKVTVMDNVLSISVLDQPAGPITISNVTFA